MWILLIIAVHVNDPTDVPAKLNMTTETKEECEKLAQSLDYWIKFKQFKLETTCLQKK